MSENVASKKVCVHFCVIMFSLAMMEKGCLNQLAYTIQNVVA